MRIIKRLPILSLQEAVYGLLEKGQTAQVYRAVPPQADESPYITIGLCTVKPEDTKEEALWNCTLAIDIWSTGAGAGDIIEADSDDTAGARHPAHRSPSRRRKSTKPSTTSAI